MKKLLLALGLIIGLATPAMAQVDFGIQINPPVVVEQPYPYYVCYDTFGEPYRCAWPQYRTWYYAHPNFYFGHRDFDRGFGRRDFDRHEGFEHRGFERGRGHR